MSGEPATETTDDVFLGGKLAVLQPATAYRAGLDAVLLAAAARMSSQARVLDAGSGVGVVGLCVAARCEDATVTLVERQAVLASLARENAARNGLAARVGVIEADITAPAVDLAQLGLAAETFDVVLANPPYMTTGQGRSPPNPVKAAAHEMADGDLDLWLRFLARMARPGGQLGLIHRADALGAVLVAVGRRFGAVEVIPLYPRAGEPAHRVIVRGVKGSRAPLVLCPGVVLHGRDNRFLPEIDAVLRDGAALQVGPPLLIP